MGVQPRASADTRPRSTNRLPPAMKAGRVLRMLLALAVVALAATLAGCGTSEDKNNLSEGEPVQLGDLQYTVEFSRFLNPSDVEDHQYLVGQPAPTADQTYLGIFVRILNKNKSSAATIPSGWTITDTQNQNYYPIPSKSLYALHLGTPIAPEDQVPVADSAAQVGPIQGSLVLFLLPVAATQDRPLRLIIPGQGGPAEVNLDL
jgi:hypothetical protein